MGKARNCSSSINGGAPRIERKIIEKNRRNKMKTLYFNLISLIPSHHSKMEGLPLPDQIEEAESYIKTLNTKLDKIRLKKEILLQTKKTSDSCITTSTTTTTTTPLIEIHAMDHHHNLNVVLANGLQDYSKFHDMIRLMNQNGGDIVSASFNRYGNSTIQVLQDKVVESDSCCQGETTMSRKLKELVCGASVGGNEQFAESRLSVWDYEIGSNIWEFEIKDA
ncbi:transcription factor bHLH162-like [Andrographis paniculata]|uniref:transcription factor bHLH162-like n=1 Tax=Andrographis paniculata TaxID=175694 RepID=UPI0021E8C5F3|nr:transcription factor bHLH162-like [Andrographis paniculata]